MSEEGHPHDPLLPPLFLPPTHFQGEPIDSRLRASNEGLPSLLTAHSREAKTPRFPEGCALRKHGSPSDPIPSTYSVSKKEAVRCLGV